MADTWRSNDNQDVPDLLTIRNGRVPARWSRSLVDLKSHSQDDYTFTPAPTKNVGQFELLPATQTMPSEDKVVVCDLCPHYCKIARGKTGRCSARINIDGKLFARFYGRPVSVAIDPIEKKPLYHFLPSSPILSLGARGCNLSCKFCQNWQISQPLPINASVDAILEPQQVVRLALDHQCPSVAFTYNEPTIWAEYVVDVSRLCRQYGIRTVAVTNGMISGTARKDFYNAVDAANVDLKAFSQSFYANLTGGDIEDVKATLKYIAKETDVWFEITNLLIPGRNDSSTEIRDMCRWIVEEIGPFTPLHFSAFFPAWRLKDNPPTSLEKLVEATEIAKEVGVKHVYRGNLRDDSGQSTYCARCGATLIIRSGFKTELTSWFECQSSQVRCLRCGEPLVGVFE